MKSLANLILSIFTAVLGFHINENSIFWAIVDGLFWPFAWVKWLICQEVSFTIISNAFQFLTK